LINKVSSGPGRAARGELAGHDRGDQRRRAEELRNGIVRLHTSFWGKFRAVAAGTSGVITLVPTVMIAVFTVLMWLIMSR
jgi:hypothetical protein